MLFFKRKNFKNVSLPAIFRYIYFLKFIGTHYKAKICGITSVLRHFSGFIKKCLRHRKLDDCEHTTSCFPERVG